MQVFQELVIFLLPVSEVNLTLVRGSKAQEEDMITLNGRKWGKSLGHDLGMT